MPSERAPDGGVRSASWDMRKCVHGDRPGRRSYAQKFLDLRSCCLPVELMKTATSSSIRLTKPSLQLLASNAPPCWPGSATMQRVPGGIAYSMRHSTIALVTFPLEISSMGVTLVAALRCTGYKLWTCHDYSHRKCWDFTGQKYTAMSKEGNTWICFTDP